MHPYRSVLFVPGHKPEWADKAVAAGADCLVLDLEALSPAVLANCDRRGVAGRTER